MYSFTCTLAKSVIKEYVKMLSIGIFIINIRVGNKNIVKVNRRRKD